MSSCGVLLCLLLFTKAKARYSDRYSEKDQKVILEVTEVGGQKGRGMGGGWGRGGGDG